MINRSQAPIKQISLVDIAKFILLFLSYIFGFILLYIFGAYSVDAFQSVGKTVAAWPVPGIISSILILSWETVPIMMLLLIVNHKLLRLSLKQFLICTVSFILLSVIFMELVIRLI